jgi:hypothetical protein
LGVRPLVLLARTPSRLAATLLILTLFLVNAYRAFTQSISHDEALIYEWYLSGPWSDLVNFEHGNHHVLADVLSKLSITVFGVSEISLRLPSLLSGLLYFCSIYALSLLLFGKGALFLLAVAFLSLNPFVLDYFVLSRGYGLALGFFFYALYQLVRYLTRLREPDEGGGPHWMLLRAGIALGLSIGSNVVMLFPGGALAFWMLCLYWMERPLAQTKPPVAGKSKKPTFSKSKLRKRDASDAPEPTPVARGPRGWQSVFLRFVLPAIVIGGGLSLIPKQLIELEPGYLGPPSLFDALEPLVHYSLLHSAVGFLGFAAWIPAEAVIRIATLAVVPMLLAALVVMGIRIAPAWLRSGNLDSLAGIDRFLLLLAGMLPALIGMIVVSRAWFHQPYPELRTLVYVLPLLSLAALSLLVRFGAGAKFERGVSTAIAAAIALCVIQFATQFNTRYFAEWAYTAAGKDMMRVLVQEHGRTPNDRMQVGVTWQLEPVVNFYRLSWELTWMDPVRRGGPEGDFDYVLLGFDDTPLVERRPFRTLMRDELSGTLLAKRAD